MFANTGLNAGRIHSDERRCHEQRSHSRSRRASGSGSYRAHPAATIRVLAALAGDDTGVGLAEITGAGLPSTVADIEASESVLELDVLRRQGTEALVQFETTMPLLLFPIRDSGVPLETPSTVEDGEAEWEVTAPQRRLSELGTQLEGFGIPFAVEELHQHVEPDQLLTDSQLYLLRTAVERGYYDTPRRCTLTELAEALDMAKSTCSAPPCGG